MDLGLRGRGAIVAVVQDRFGRVNICVTNSGGLPSKLFVDTTIDDRRQALEDGWVRSLLRLQMR